MENYIGVREAHEQTKIPYNSIYWAAANGRIDGAMQPAARVWVFPREAFEHWKKNVYRPQQKNGSKSKAARS
jgi:hypothetical protein